MQVMMDPSQPTRGVHRDLHIAFLKEAIFPAEKFSLEVLRH